MDKECKANYYAVIPANVRYDKELTANAKLLYGEITTLCNDNGFCWATNSYFADLYGVSERSITNWISNLEEKEYIHCEALHEEGVEKIFYGGRKIFLGGVEKIFYHNNTYNKKENINISNDIFIKEKTFKKPTLEEVQKYCEERKNTVNPQKFVDFYESKGWFIGKNKMKDWKACIRTWENKNVKQEKETPEWFSQKQELNAMSKQEQEEIDSILNNMC